MLLDIGDIEAESLKIRLIQLRTVKKIKELFGIYKEIALNYCNYEDEYISDIQVLQYIMFHNLKYNGLKLQLCAGDIPLIRSELIKQKKITERQSENILVTPIIFELKYMKNKEKEMDKKIKKILKTLYYYDPYTSVDGNDDEAISFKPFAVKVGEKHTGNIAQDIYCPCTVPINNFIVDSILQLFL